MSPISYVFVFPAAYLQYYYHVRHWRPQEFLQEGAKSTSCIPLFLHSSLPLHSPSLPPCLLWHFFCAVKGIPLTQLGVCHCGNAVSSLSAGLDFGTFCATQNVGGEGKWPLLPMRVGAHDVRCSFTSAALIRPIQLKQQINRKQHDVTKSTFVIQLTIILESLTYFAVIQSVTRSIPLTEWIVNPEYNSGFN